MAKGSRPGGGGVSVQSATKALNAHKTGLGEGKAPKTLNIGGATLSLSSKSEYTSNGGFTVHTYKYSSNSAISRDGSNSLSFNATSYKTATGAKASGYSRRGSRVFGVSIVGGNPYSSGSSGGIGRR